LLFQLKIQGYRPHTLYTYKKINLYSKYSTLIALQLRILYFTAKAEKLSKRWRDLNVKHGGSDTMMCRWHSTYNRHENICIQYCTLFTIYTCMSALFLFIYCKCCLHLSCNFIIKDYGSSGSFFFFFYCFTFTCFSSRGFIRLSLLSTIFQIYCVGGWNLYNWRILLLPIPNSMVKNAYRYEISSEEIYFKLFFVGSGVIFF
jgi:hypothetical protein